jgi:imidazolonepropionase-like amidohydrolase
LAESINRRGFNAACRAIVGLHASGVSIVMGSDSGAWPLFPACFHGYSTLREMELLAAAGLPPMTVLQAATRLPAETLGLDGEIGTIEVGKRADMIVVAEDPLADLRALRSIQWTIQNGIARPPTEWMMQ